MKSFVKIYYVSHVAANLRLIGLPFDPFVGFGFAIWDELSAYFNQLAIRGYAIVEGMAATATNDGEGAQAKTEEP